MKSSNVSTLAKTLGVPVREYRDELINEWYMSPQYQEKLTIFILRETTPKDFWFNLKDGELKVGGKQYSVTWINNPSECRKAEYLLVSLRYCKHLERGYALVKVLKGDGQYPTLEYKE